MNVIIISTVELLQLTDIVYHDILTTIHNGNCSLTLFEYCKSLLLLEELTFQQHCSKACEMQDIHNTIQYLQISM